MCLNTLEPIKYTGNKGYKVLIKTGCNQYEGMFCNLSGNRWSHIGDEYITNNNDRVQLGTTESNRSFPLPDRPKYPAGFHLFPNLSDAAIYKEMWMGGPLDYICPNFTILEVSFDKVKATGIQNGLPCIVAGQIKLLREVTKDEYE